MEQRPKKRLGQNDDCNTTRVPSDIRGSSNTTLIKNEEATIPTLVSYIFLTNLTDVALLKSCRLVCKSWNVDATASLKACSKVVLLETRSNFTEIKNLLLHRESGPLQIVPSHPFRNFQANARTFTNPGFIEIILLPNVSITGLSFPMIDDGSEAELDQSLLGAVLAKNKASLTDLTIGATDRRRFSKEFLKYEEIKLRALKSFRFRDNCTSCTHIDFVNNIVSLCNLEMVVLTIVDGEILTKLLTQDKGNHLKFFHLHLMDMSIAALKHLSKLEFPKLQCLKFEACNHAVHVYKKSYLQHLSLFLRSISPFVQDLTINIPISNKFKFRFSNLQKIKVHNNTSVSVFTPDSFPALSKVSLDVEVSAERLISSLGNDVVPHPGVQSLMIWINGECENDLFDQDLLMFLSYLGRQFPKVSAFTFRLDFFTSTTIPAIYQSFPKLTTLDLGGCCNVFFLSGIRRDNQDAGVYYSLLKLGRPIEEIPRQNSLLDFMELENLLLDMHLNSDVLIHCLSKLPKLRQLTLNWNQFLSLSANELRDSVGHLDKIVILNSQNIPRDDLVEFSKLPNVYLR